MKPRQILLIPLIALLFCIPAFSAQAQDPPPSPRYDLMDDEFIDALVMAAVNDNILEGNDEIGELRDLSDIVANYYRKKLESVDDPFQWDAITWQANNHLSALKFKMITANGGSGLWKLLMILTDEDKLNLTRDKMGIPHFVADNDNPPPEYLNTMNKSVSGNLEANVNTALEINTISNHPGLAPIGNDSSGWSYNVPEITDPTSVIHPPSDDDDPDQSEVSIAPTATASWSDSGNQDPAPGGGSNEIIRKPLRFDNNGFDTVTVMVETYDPAPGYSPAIPTASTIVTPEGNPSAYLDLPLGTYTFCYHWQLDEDFNNDDYFDYHHRTTAPHTLNINSSDNTQSAIAVILSPDSNVSNPNGKCGETAAPVQGNTNSDLTPEEQANQGTHTYTLVYHAPGLDWLDGETVDVAVSIVFSDGTAIIGAVGEEQYTIFRFGHNTYTWLDENGNIQTYFFTLEGFEIQAKVGIVGEYSDSTTICTRHD